MDIIRKEDVASSILRGLPTPEEYLCWTTYAGMRVAKNTIKKLYKKYCGGGGAMLAYNRMYERLKESEE